MDSPENSFDAGAPPSPSPDGASNRAFKPPTRPGASLKGRKSTAALSEIGTNRLHASSMQDSDQASSTVRGSDDRSAEHSRNTSRVPTPESAYDSPAHYEGVPSSKEAQALAATQAARQRLQSLYNDNDRQTTAAGLLGQGLLEQRNQIETLREELHEELSRLENESGDEGTASTQEIDRYDHIKSLADRIDVETANMATKRKALIRELLSAGGQDDSETAQSSLSGLPPGSTNNAYAFLSSDPASRSTPTKNIPDLSVTGVGGLSTGGPTPRQNDRRARNAAAPSSIGDQNLVNQLQEGLVQEIRRLQGLLMQRDQQVKLSEESQKKSDEELALWKPKALALMEQEDAMKQENWDLQVSGQQLEEQLEQERTAIRKLEAEKSRATRELAKARETADERKVQIDGQAAELEKIQALRETETALARREKASMQRDYSDLQTEMNKYKTEAQRLERANVSRSASNSLLLDSMSGADESTEGMLPADVIAARKKFDNAAPASPGGFSEDISNGQSPLGSRLLRDREIADARGKLALAHKKAGKDSAEKRKLREQNAELRRLLAGAGVDAPSGLEDVESSDDDASIWVDEEGSVGGKRRSKHAHLPKSSTRPNIASRLGLAPSAISHDFEDGDEAEDSFEDATDDQASEATAEDADETGSDYHGAAKKYRRRSTIRPNHNKRVSVSSPLVQTLALSEETETNTADQDDELGGEHDQSLEEGIKRRVPTSRRSAVPKLRPASDAAPAAALGSELQGLGSEFLADSSTSRGAEGSIIEHPDEREVNDAGAQTEPFEDLVKPALSAQRAEHEDAIAKLHASYQAEHASALENLHNSITSKHESSLAELQQRHRSRVEDLVREHEEAVAQLHVAHRGKVEEHQRSLTELLAGRDRQSAEEVGNLERSHESALSERDAAHAAALAAALAAHGKKHDSAMSEARTRHTQALADQVAAHTSALSRAERSHQAALDKRERLHKADLERRRHSHLKEIDEKAREHQDMIEDINATNDAFLRQRDAAYNSALKDRDEQVVKARAEVSKLRKELEDMAAELARARRELADALADGEKKVKDLETAEAAHVAALAAANAEVEDIRRDQAQAESAADTPSPAQEADSARHSLSGDANEVFQDANDEPTPAVPVEEEGVRRVVLADLKDSSIQTDDAMWLKTQQERLLLHPSSVAYARPGETAVGPGGITVLGGYPSRPRDSVGTFGASREHDGALSPALTSFSAHPADPPMDSATSNLRQSEQVPLDKSKPPVMQVPPPPSMPPPSHIPRKSGASMLSHMEDAATPTPPRPTSPPPANLVSRASGRHSTLRVPTSKDSDLPPRSMSRASSHAGGPPPSSYTGPAASIRKKLTRRGSDMSGVDGDSVASASILSRLSSRGGPHHLRQTSGTSIASDATSDMSRRPSFASSQASDAVGDRTLTAADARRAGRGANKRASTGPANALGVDGESTNPEVIQAITQTMIGEYLYKYTRKTMRTGHSDKRHRRYFWVHPYTKMLYWTMADPGGARMAEGVSKSACIEDVTVVEDSNVSPPGLHYASIIIKTAARDLKVTAPDRERHEVWLNALGYLVNRGGMGSAQADSNIVANATATPAGSTRSRAATTSRAARLLSPSRSLANVGRTKSSEALGQRDEDGTPRPRARNDSTAALSTSGAASYRSKRRDTGAWEYLQNASTNRRAQSEMGFRQDDADQGYYDELGRLDNRLKTAEQMLEENDYNGEGFEGLDNVRACCGGAHDVGALAHKNYVQKNRRGSTQSTAGYAGSRASLGRPSSRLSAGTASLRTRPRGHSNASESTSSHAPPLPPQLGPLNLNGRSAGRNSGGKAGGETIASMFDLPPPGSNDASASTIRPRSSQGQVKYSARPSSGLGRSQQQGGSTIKSTR
ncbi:unnamed protein product [Sympodiomycopsis kandeliae]